eukprot:SM000049S16694  [mRNA]  locus=s49:113601:114811:+ [translate_table: standard]
MSPASPAIHRHLMPFVRAREVAPWGEHDPATDFEARRFPASDRVSGLPPPSQDASACADCTGCRCSGAAGGATAQDGTDLACSLEECPCGQTVDGHQAYDKYGRLQVLARAGTWTGEEESRPCKRQREGGTHSQQDDFAQPAVLSNKRIEPLLVMECGEGCPCDNRCPNRLSQRGLATPVTVVRHPCKGWGLHAAADIPQGAYVCEYAGELLTNVEAQQRLECYDEAQKARGGSESMYLLVVREHLPSGRACLRLNVDPLLAGNIGRFMNHSCSGGNISVCLTRPAGCLVPRVGLFASRHVACSEELTFSYGVANPEIAKGDQVPLAMRCYCGSENCIGYLPREPV